MTKTIEALLEQLKENGNRKYRTRELEAPVVYPVDLFGFNFGTEYESEWGSGNVTPNYTRALSKGLLAIREDIVSSMQNAKTEQQIAFGNKMLASLDKYIDIAKEHKKDALAAGNTRLYETLERVPLYPATSFYEACTVIRSMMYFFRYFNATHIGLGRFDQYMYPYYLADRKRGVSDEEIFETLEAFFVSLNHDIDLYRGWMVGDNGQSMVLGGFDKDGKSVYNELSEMCMRASLELELIDPKINLRVGKNTPIELYELGTELTKKGLGFPQYCNDDVVVPGLIKLGYDPDDAQNYVVAACWEYIIPGCGADIPNKRSLNFPLAVNRAITENLCFCQSFDELMTYAKREIERACDAIIEYAWGYIEHEGVELSIFIDGCIESLTNMWECGAKYNNFGSHGAGIANAADALAAVKKLVFDDKTVSAQELVDALENNFADAEELRHKLLACPKMGNNDDYVDSIASKLMDYFGEYLNGKPNGIGGIWRAGTGTAMEYVRAAQKTPATADGRHDGDSFGTNFSPSLEIRPSGILSVVQSFTKHDMTNIINGGPLTLEIHDTVLRNDIGIKKTAALVKAFIDLGGHQLQLNSINRERLLDAREHPEKYPNLIVRVWGWSGYWNDLRTEYQDHIIRRIEFMG
ncbi:MAG: pyruvate formate-lyase [Clostridia bacterium]|nr:pyruvate formate-lyase [Clostridia bacterium]